MPVKKPSAKPSKGQKTVSAKTARPVAKAAATAAAKPVTAKEKAVPRKTDTAAAKPVPKPAPARAKPARAPVPVAGAEEADLEMNPSLLSGPLTKSPNESSAERPRRSAASFNWVLSRAQVERARRTQKVRPLTTPTAGPY